MTKSEMQGATEYRYNRPLLLYFLRTALETPTCGRTAPGRLDGDVDVDCRRGRHCCYQQRRRDAERKYIDLYITRRLRARDIREMPRGRAMLRIRQCAAVNHTIADRCQKRLIVHRATAVLGNAVGDGRRRKPIGSKHIPQCTCRPRRAASGIGRSSERAKRGTRFFLCATIR